MDGATFAVRERSVTALIGPNGAGKTTAFNLLTGFIKAEGGTVVFDGEDVTGKRPDEIARHGMVRTFQLTRVLAKMKVHRERHARRPGPAGRAPGHGPLPARGAGGSARPRCASRRWRCCGEVGIHTHAEEYAATLSGGQRKLLELARALMTEPRLVLLDEPMAGVNPTLGHRLLDYLARLREERGLTVLFVEHDMDVVMGVSDEVVVMAQGKVIAHGTPDEVRGDAAVIDAYLGAEPAAA